MCVVCILIVALQPTFLTRIMLFVSAPFQSARVNVSANTESFLGGFSSRAALVEKNKALEEELIRVKIKSNLYDSLRREYYKTTDTSTSTTRLLSTRILEKPPFSLYDTVLIDIGTAAGVSVGDTVSFDTTVALGVVDTTSSNASRVRLFSSPGYEQEVRVGTNDFVVLAHGKGGGVFEVSVPKEIAVARNDNVFLATGENIGTFKKIVESEAEAFTTAQVVIPQNIFELRTVYVHTQKELE